MAMVSIQQLGLLSPRIAITANRLLYADVMLCARDVSTKAIGIAAHAQPA